jgi:peptidoglycan hydrolase-like protein with peptidoglycan-binding domain
MQTLQLGSSGPQVVQLQQKLKQIGTACDPGPIDGMFGQTTYLAVKAFQNSKGLVADGVAGTKTLAMLGLIPADTDETTFKDLKVKAPSGVIFELVDGAKISFDSNKLRFLLICYCIILVVSHHY